VKKRGGGWSATSFSEEEGELSGREWRLQTWRKSCLRLACDGGEKKGGEGTASRRFLFRQVTIRTQKGKSREYTRLFRPGAAKKNLLVGCRRKARCDGEGRPTAAQHEGIFGLCGGYGEKVGGVNSSRTCARASMACARRREEGHVIVYGIGRSRREGERGSIQIR